MGNLLDDVFNIEGYVENDPTEEIDPDWVANGHYSIGNYDINDFLEKEDEI